MKNLLVVVVALLGFACSQETGFKINVQLEGAEGKVVLEDRVGGAWVGIDTADIAEGTAVLEGAVNYPTGYYLSIVGQRAKTMVFVENTEMTVAGKASELNKVNVSGSVTHDEYSALNDKVNKIQKEYMAIYQDARKANSEGDTTKAKELMEEVNRLYETVGPLQEEFVKNNPASYAAPHFLRSLQYGKSAEQLDSMVAGLDPKLLEVQQVKDLMDRIAKLKTVAVGKIAPDFTQNDSEGNPVKLSEIYSKHELTLIDFWASWCGPCRAENPNVVAVFNDYKDKGFTVFGVSLDDDKDKWLEAIQKDELNWAHVSDLAGWKNAAAGLYAVNSIPSSLLVDKNGKIIAKNKREAELREAVAAYFEGL